MKSLPTSARSAVKVFTLGLGLWLLLVWMPGAAAASLTSTPRVTSVHALEDVSGELSLRDVIGADNWRALAGTALSAGYTRSAWWFRLEITAQPRQAVVVSVQPPYLDDVAFHLPGAWGVGAGIDPDAPAYRLSRQGDTRPLGARSIQAHSFNARILTPEAGSLTVYLRVQSSSSMIPRFTLDAEEDFHERRVREEFVFGAMAGIVLVMLAAASLMYRSTREPLYAHYAFASIVIGLYLAATNGYLSLLPFLDGELASDLTSALILGYIASHALIARQILEVSRISRELSVALVVVAMAEISGAILALFGLYAHFAEPAVFVGLILPFCTLGLALYAWPRGLGLSGTTVASFAALALGHVPLMLGLFGLLGTPTWGIPLAQVAGVVYLLLMLQAMIEQSGQRNRALRRAELETELSRRTLEMQARGHEVQREWVSMISHEIKTPLAVIDASRQSLQRLLPTPEVQQRLQRMQRGVERIDALVHELVSQREFEARHAGLRLETIDIRAWLRDVAETALGDAQTRLRLEATPALDARIDPDLVAIAVNNLLHNALRHGQRETEITVTAERIGEWLRIGVESVGSPIPPDRRAAVFERFTAFGDRSGHGVGLWACRSIARAHGGDAELEVTKRGNRFALRLPVLPPEDIKTLVSADKGIEA